MGAALNDRITLELLEEISANPDFSIPDLMRRFGVSKDKAQKTWARIKNVSGTLHQKIVQDTQKNAGIIDRKPIRSNPFPRDTPEHANWDQLERGDVLIGEIYVMSYCRCFSDKAEGSHALDGMPDALAILSDALDTVSMPWMPGNDWKSMVLRKKDPCGKTVLHLLQLDPLELKEDIETILAALKEINRPEEKKKPEPTPPATQLNNILETLAAVRGTPPRSSPAVDPGPQVNEGDLDAPRYVRR